MSEKTDADEKEEQTGSDLVSSIHNEIINMTKKKEEKIIQKPPMVKNYIKNMVGTVQNDGQFDTYKMRRDHLLKE